MSWHSWNFPLHADLRGNSRFQPRSAKTIVPESLESRAFQGTGIMHLMGSTLAPAPACGRGGTSETASI